MYRLHYLHVYMIYIHTYAMLLTFVMGIYY